MTPDQEPEVYATQRHLLAYGPRGEVLAIPRGATWGEVTAWINAQEEYMRDTSREAYARVKLTAGKCRRLVLEMLRLNPSGMTHDQIIQRLGIRYAASSLRTRTSELVKVGLVKADTRYGKSLLGNRATIWKVTEAGAAWAPTDGDPAAPK
jgi:hypothetical protein